MNIGITVYPTYGGSVLVGSELGKELAERGHTVHFIASALPTRLTQLNERVRFHEVEMMSYPLFEHQPTRSRWRPRWRRWLRKRISTCSTSTMRFHIQSVPSWRGNHLSQNGDFQL